MAGRWRTSGMGGASRLIVPIGQIGRIPLYWPRHTFLARVGSLFSNLLLAALGGRRPA